MNQWDIRWFTFHHPDKRRPVLLVTRDDAIPFLSRVTVAPVTSNVRRIASEVSLSQNEGMSRPSAASFDNLATVDKQRLGELIGRLPRDRFDEAFDAISYAFGFTAFTDVP